MRRLICTVAAAGLALATSAPLAAQKTTQIHPGTGGSPHVRTDWTIDGAQISIEYGRPYLKGRPGSRLMPIGQPWRTGADEATVITSDKPLKFGSISLAPGSYTINTEPGQQSWQLIIGKLGSKGQWGIPYQPALEIGRAPMTLTHTNTPVEQLTYAIDDTPAGATLRIEWATVRVTIPFTVG